jgi:hypothetical protein
MKPAAPNPEGFEQQHSEWKRRLEKVHPQAQLNPIGWCESGVRKLSVFERLPGAGFDPLGIKWLGKGQWQGFLGKSHSTVQPGR